MKALLIILLFVRSLTLQAGEKEARRYFAQRSQTDPVTETSEASANSNAAPRYMKIYAGFHYDNKAFSWGKKDSENSVSQFQAGVVYRVGEWENSMDYLWQFDFTTYKIDGENPLKFTVMPVISFPDVNSRFPLYFGIGAGLGGFFRQVADESTITLDYQLFAGLRWLNVIGSSGIFIESGLRNQIFLLSGGQHNALFLNLGANFNF